MLSTERLLLREWEIKDIDDLIEGLNNLEVSKWLALVPFPYTEKDAKEWIDYCLKEAKKGEPRSSYNFAIELKSENKVIGGLGLDNINKLHETAGGGIWLNANYHGKGYGTEAFSEKVRFAFQDLDLRRLENGYFEGNQASLNMLEKIGYKSEGFRRKAMKSLSDGKFKDDYIMGLLKEEWSH